MSEEMRSSGPLRSPGVSGALSICDGLDAALYREKDVQQIGVYQDGDCHNAISPRALHQIQLDPNPTTHASKLMHIRQKVSASSRRITKAPKYNPNKTL